MKSSKKYLFYNHRVLVYALELNIVGSTTCIHGDLNIFVFNSLFNNSPSSIKIK